MIDLSIRAGVLAHAVHYAVLGVGIAGLAVLVGPQLLGRPARAVDDEHSRRIRLLDEQIAAGSLGTTTALRTLPLALAPGTAPVAATDLRSSLLLPVAILSSAAAAGVHAAVGPDHFRERFLFGMFFAVAALAQITWSVVVAFRPDRRLLQLAVVGNLAVVALWAVTRTTGLGALLPAPEAVGPWDLAAGAWELLAAACAFRLLAPGAPPLTRLAPWVQWHRYARACALASVAVLAALSVSGAGS
jgi:hypothetical protein